MHWAFLRNWQGFLPWLKESHAQIKLASDASSFAWRGVLNHDTEPVVICDFWPPHKLGLHINVKEALALVNVPKAFSVSIRDQWVDIYTDSRDKSHDLCDALKKLFWTSMKYNCGLTLYYVPSSSNPADLPSRSPSLQDSKLSKETWAKVQSRFGPHSADLMAIPSNVQTSPDGSHLPFFSPYHVQ